MARERRSPVEAKEFRKTFARWGSWDHRDRKANSWLNAEILKPAGYTYEQLTEGLHPDQSAYRRFFADVAAHLLVMGRRRSASARYLELGCGNATDAARLLERYAPLWKEPSPRLEMHFLDIDTGQLEEARANISRAIPSDASVHLWEGDLEELAKGAYRLHESLGRVGQGAGQRLPGKFDLVFAQLVLHEYPLLSLTRIFRAIGGRLKTGGHFIWSDICYTGDREYDAIIWNRTLRQIESMEAGPRREFWLRHYIADSSGYYSRGEVMEALRVAGFEGVAMLQCSYDMALIAARWPGKGRRKAGTMTSRQTGKRRGRALG